MQTTTENLYTPGKIRTYTGRYINALFVRPGDIHIEDIAHALSLNCRWGGHCKVHYSVAQHCVLGARMMQSHGCTKEYVLSFLLHDAEEAYLHDLPKPIKERMPEYAREAKLLRFMIHNYLRVPAVEKAIIDEYDKRMLEFEWENIVLTYNKAILPAWHPEYAKEQFLKMYNELTCA